MHLKFSSRLVKLTVIAGLYWMGILMALTLSDYLTRGWGTTDSKFDRKPGVQGPKSRVEESRSSVSGSRELELRGGSAALYAMRLVSSTRIAFYGNADASKMPAYRRLPIYRFHRYSLTICTRLRKPLHDVDVVSAVLLTIRQCAITHEFAVFSYCFMPDDVHLVVSATAEAADLRKFMSNWK